MEDEPASHDPVIDPSTEAVDVDMPEDELSIQPGYALEASGDPIVGPNTQPADFEMAEDVPSIPLDGGESQSQSLSYLDGRSSRNSAHSSVVAEIRSQHSQ